MAKEPMYGVYRVYKNGKHRYISRTATHSQKLAEDIAKGMTEGEVVAPDGRVVHIHPYPHIAKQIE